jgi:hypothetical protein
MERFVDLFVLFNNLSLFLETIMPLVIYLFAIGSLAYVTFKGNAMLCPWCLEFCQSSCMVPEYCNHLFFF